MREKTRNFTLKGKGQFIWMLFLAFALVLAACQPAETPTEPPEAAPTEAAPEQPVETEAPAEPQPVGDAPPELIAANWVLVLYGNTANPVVVEPGTRVSANFNADGTMGGSCGCNSYNTSYQVNGEQISFGPAAVTAMACETGMDQEAAYLAALEKATSYQIVGGDRLLINYEGGSGVAEQLVYDAETPLVNTVWVLSSYGDPNDPTSSQPGVVTTAVFAANGTLSGSAGCNQYSAGYTVQENQISFGMPTSTMMACETGMEQEQAYLAALELAESYTITGDSLEITYANGAAALRYSARHLPLENVRWLVSLIDGQPLPAGISAEALFTPGGEGQDNSVNGNAGCNGYFGAYTVEGNNLSIPGPFGLTQMMCDEAAMQVERSYLAGLEGAQTYESMLSNLTITTANGSLVYRADRAPLEGPLWMLTSLGQKDNPQPPAAEANFLAKFERAAGMPSGVIAGSTGCNDYASAYYANLSELKVNLPQSSGNACSPALNDQESLYFQGLNSARAYRILGNELQIPFGEQVLNFVATYPPGEETPTGPLSSLNGTKWWLVSTDTFQVLPGSETTAALEINPNGLTGRIAGSGGCNTYNAEIVGVFQVGPINATKSLCDTPPGIMQQESAYLAALGVAQSFTLDEGTLLINTNLGTLVYSNQGPEAVQPLPPTDTPEAVQPLPPTETPEAVQPLPSPEAPAAVISAPTEGQVNQPAGFDGSASTPQGEIITYVWDFGDGSGPVEGATVNHAFAAAGTYNVTLTVTDTQGETNSTTHQITIT